MSISFLYSIYNNIDLPILSLDLLETKFLEYIGYY